MKRKFITTTLGIILFLCGVFLYFQNKVLGSIILLVIGSTLIYLSFQPGRTKIVIFGHICVFVGCFLTTWGIYLLPYSEPKVEYIFLRPLFWGLFSIFGGICAIYHGFCRCVRRGYGEQKIEIQNPTPPNPQLKLTK